MMLRKTNLLVALFVIQNASLVSAQPLFHDDFDQATELAPHRSSANSGTRSVQGGDWIWEANGGGLMSSFLPGLPTSDVSIRTRVRMLDEPVGDWVFLGIYGRHQGGNYWGGVGSNGSLFVGIDDGGIQIRDQRNFAQTTGVPVNLRLDIIGDEIKLWGWNEGQSKPTQPQLTMIDTRFPSGDGAGLIFNPRSSTNNPRVAFDFFQVTAIPEPSTWLLTLLGSIVLVAMLRKTHRPNLFTHSIRS